MSDFFSKTMSDLGEGLRDLEKYTLDCYLSPWNDLRVQADSSPKGRKHGRIRNMSEITGIVLHCTGRHDFHTSVEWLEHIGTNFFIPKSGIIQYCHNVLELRWSTQNILSPKTVAVEFIGNFRMTNENWRRKGAHAGHHDMPSNAQILAGRRLIRYLKSAYRITEVYGHLHAKSKKPDDPGMDIWANVGEWGISQGLIEGKPTSSGIAVPDSWRDKALRTVPF